MKLNQVIETLRGYGFGYFIADGERDKSRKETAQAIVDLSKHECEWVLEDTILDESFYATQCGIHPSFGPGEPRDLEESGYKYCHYCGGEVKEIT